MPHKLIIKPEAEIELIEALEWYEKKQTGLGRKLYLEFDTIFEDIATRPEHFQKRYRDIRVRFTRTFNFGIHYTFENDTMFVHAIWHTSRKPLK
ncbi:type II toxin-antitoxin system RelE/ParE family toxin [Hyunsoonleella rubra]|uniref:Type II toxin-antitoxin system RelE/ParE family toxin n=1 Tax=Hyunsoonleella rubra TaxID=1737062 RepID=A0ABW5TCG2_9FLAO